jgi:hypothetical protein
VSGHFKDRYGASPLHLIAHVLAFAVAAYALVQLLGEKHWVNFVGWFFAAALLHDLVLLPAYSVIDLLTHGVLRRVHLPNRPGQVPIVNHVRAPALISAVLLLIYFPLILGPGDAAYFSATGHHPAGYLRNWLAITLALFAGSAVIYEVRARAARRRTP